MLKSLVLLIHDKVYLALVITALFLSLAAFFTFRQYLIKSGGVWLAPIFIPIYFYVVVIFVINAALSVILYRKDRFLSYAENGATIIVNLMLLLAMLINLNNPNG